MMKEQYGEPRASPSNPPVSIGLASNTGSSFQQGNEGMAIESGASDMSMVVSMTDITLDQALMKLREIDRENALLKEHMANNNQQIKRQFEALRSLNIKDKEKVDRFKALISSLREDVKELQIKNMAQEDREKENAENLKLTENENALLQRQKALCEQRLVNIMKHAEIQGVVGLDDMEGLPDISDAVFVTTEDKEREIENLEANLSAKEEIISDVRNELVNVKFQRDQYKMSNEVLFKDMDGLQKQKEELARERRQLHEQNAHLSKELDELMQSNIASTKKEIVEVQRYKVEEKKVQALNVSGCLDSAENLEEMFDQKLNLQEHQDEIRRLKTHIDAQQAEKSEVDQKVKLLTTELNELKSELASTQGKIDQLEREKNEITQEYQDNLTSITYQRKENERIQQAKVSEDQSALRSQVISLLSEVDELNKKLSLASMAMLQKDKRINELTNVNADWKIRFDEQVQESSSMIHTLQTQLSQQNSGAEQRMDEQNETKQRYQSLQDNFSRLVNDYKDLLEMFENEKCKPQPGMTKEQMEEMDKMAAQVIAAEEAIRFRDKQLEEYNIRNNDMDENIKLLHIQLETYRADFQTERDSRTELMHDKNELEEELKKSQDQVKALEDQQNQRHMEEIQRRVSQTQRFPTYTDAQHLHNNRDANTPPSQQLQYDAYHQLHASMPHPHASNANSNNSNYRPQNNPATHSSYAYGHPNQLLNAGAGSQFDDPDADQFPSLVYDCPTCGKILPDTDTLQLHVADCLDQQQ